MVEIEGRRDRIEVGRKDVGDGSQDMVEGLNRSLSEWSPIRVS
jgi:hypothetical protein